jgi:hypothetical protein
MTASSELPKHTYTMKVEGLLVDILCKTRLFDIRTKLKRSKIPSHASDISIPFQPTLLETTTFSGMLSWAVTVGLWKVLNVELIFIMFRDANSLTMSEGRDPQHGVEFNKCSLVHPSHALKLFSTDGYR